MKSISAPLIAVAVTLAASDASVARDFPVLEGPCLGQTPPGTTAGVFAPGVISTDDWEVEAMFAPACWNSLSSLVAEYANDQRLSVSSN